MARIAQSSEYAFQEKSRRLGRPAARIRWMAATVGKWWLPDSRAHSRLSQLLVTWSLLLSLISLSQVAGAPPARAAGGPMLPNQLDLANVPSRPSVFASVNGVGYLLTDPAVGENTVRSYDPTRTRPLNGSTKASVGDWDGDGRDEMLLFDASGRLQLLDDASTGFTLLAETSGVTAATFARTGWTAPQEIIVARGNSLTRYPDRQSLIGRPTSQVFDARMAQGTLDLSDGDRGVPKVTDLRPVSDIMSGGNAAQGVVATYLSADRRNAHTRLIDLVQRGFGGQGVTMAGVSGVAITDAAGLADGSQARGYDISISAVGDNPGQTLSKRAIWRMERTGAFGQPEWREVSRQNLECGGDRQASLASAVLPPAHEPRLVVACPMNHRVGQGLNVRLSFSVSDMRQASVGFAAASIERPTVALVAQTYGHADRAAGFQDELDLVGVAVTVERGSRQVRGGAVSWVIPNPDRASNIDLGNVKGRKDGFSFGEAANRNELPFAFTAQNNGRITIRAERVDDGCPTTREAREACKSVALPPRPIALIQAPPLVRGLGQEFVPPTFVTGTSRGETTERSVSYTVKSALGLTIEVPSVVEAGVTFTIEAQLGESKAVSRGVSISEAYFGSYDDSTVIYIEDALWTAKYRITQASDGLGIGKVQHLLIPRASTMRQMELGNFRRNHPEVTDGSRAHTSAWNDAFRGTPGHPGTYPLLTGRPSDLSDVRCQRSGQDALRGGPAVGSTHRAEMNTSGAQSSSVRIGTNKDHTTSFDLSLGVEGMLKAGAMAKVAQTLGISRAAGESFTVSAGTDVGVDAYVGNIKQKEVELGKDESYRWRLYFCKREIGGWPMWVAGFHTAEYKGRGGYLDPEVSPAGPTHNGNVSTTPTLSWMASGTVGRFDVEVRSRDSSRVRSFNQSFEPSRAVTHPRSAPHTFQQAISSSDKLTSGEAYEWRVTAVGLTGAEQRSEWQSFRAWDAPTVAPSVHDPLVHPDGSLTIGWAPPPGAKGWVYDVSVHDPAGAPVVSFVGVEGTHVRTGPLQQGKTYRVKVSGRNPMGTGPAGEKTVVVRCGLKLPVAPELGCVVAGLVSSR